MCVSAATCTGVCAATCIGVCAATCTGVYRGVQGGTRGCMYSPACTPPCTPITDTLYGKKAQKHESIKWYTPTHHTTPHHTTSYLGMHQYENKLCLSAFSSPTSSSCPMRLPAPSTTLRCPPPTYGRVCSLACGLYCCVRCTVGCGTLPTCGTHRFGNGLLRVNCVCVCSDDMSIHHNPCTRMLLSCCPTPPVVVPPHPSLSHPPPGCCRGCGLHGCSPYTKSCASLHD